LEYEGKKKKTHSRVSGAKGQKSVLLEKRILESAKHYSKLTVRQLFYILVSVFGYPSSKNFYKTLDYHLTKMRRVNVSLHAKFVDRTRQFIAAPIPFREVEFWVEKDSIRNFLEDLAMKYRLSIQVLRGFASLSMYRNALSRAAGRGVKKILYAGDFDPSGLLIDKVAEREMSIKVYRIALTMEQIREYQPPWFPVNMKDSRAEDYVAKYGDHCWDVESLRPKTFLKLVEERLKDNVPDVHLVEAEFRDRASSISRPIVEALSAIVQEEVVELLGQGVSRKEILHRLASRYGLDRGYDSFSVV
jgi:hypothetical protein